MSEQEITFPLDWEFRIVAVSEAVSMVQASCLGILHRADPGAVIARGLESKGGKYITLRAVCHIPDRDVLKAVSDALVAVNGVKMLI